MNEVDKNLSSILEAEIVEGELVGENQIIQYDETEEMLAPVVVPQQQPNDNLNRDIEFDYEKSRETHRDLIDIGQEMLSDLQKVAKESQHPRAYEVAFAGLKNISDMTDKLMSLHKNKKELDGSKGSESTSTPSIAVNQAVFVGSTAELLKKLKK